MSVRILHCLGKALLNLEGQRHSSQQEGIVYSAWIGTIPHEESPCAFYLGPCLPEYFPPIRHLETMILRRMCPIPTTRNEHTCWHIACDLYYLLWSIKNTQEVEGQILDLKVIPVQCPFWPHLEEKKLYLLWCHIIFPYFPFFFSFPPSLSSSFFFWDRVSLCCPGWSAVAWSWLTAASASWF